MREKTVPAWTGADTIRTLLLGWLAGTALGYTVLPRSMKVLSMPAAVNAVSAPLLAGFGAAAAAAVALLGRTRDVRKPSRWAIFGLTLLILGQAVLCNRRLSFAAAAIGLTGLVLVYALFGQSSAPRKPLPAGKHTAPFLLGTVLAGLAAAAFLIGWGVGRIRLLVTPTYDFGLFAQMFQKMKQTGLPLTTLERDGLISHFTVHLSPIYYLLLPFYLLWPKPETLPVLQALILTSAAIPLWCIGKQLGLSPAQRFCLCLVLFLYPAFSGGIYYDLHENAFLTPLLFWLFWAAGRRSAPWTAVFALLTAAVKEDAAVYVGVFGLYLILSGIADPKRRWELRAGLGLLGGALIWFLCAVAILSRYGEGVMRYRYENLMASDSSSLFSLVLTVIGAPLKVLYECVRTAKLRYILYTMAPLLGLPFLTRRYERLTLLIPWVLLNLMPAYQYQHSVYFQYNFGSMAFLFYGAALNLRDLLPALRKPWLRAVPLLLAAAVSAVGFWRVDWPLGKAYLFPAPEWTAQCRAVRERLEAIPQDCSVTATTYYTTALYDRQEVYDLSYTSLEHLLASDYVVLEPRFDWLYTDWTEEGEAPGAGLSNLTNCLLSNGFTLYDQLDDRLIIYRREG